VAVRHPGSSSPEAVVERSMAIYRGALGGRDLVVELTADGFEETAVVANRSQPTSYTVEFTLPGGVSARQGEGVVEFVDATGGFVARYGSGLAIDAKGVVGAVSVTLLPGAEVAPPAPTTTTAGPATTTTTAPAGPGHAGSVVQVEVAADEAWAADAGRAFPLSIDPNFSTVVYQGWTSTYPGWGSTPATAVYDAGRRLIETTDTAGRKATTVRDGDAERGAYRTGRVTDAFGPGPPNCFNSSPPTSACPDLPHTSTVYDAVPGPQAQLPALQGLAVAWWDNPTLGGGRSDLGAMPRAHTEIAPDGSGSLVGAPPAAVGSGWSARYSGEIDLGSGGTYGFRLAVAGKGRLWVDDVVVVDAWASGGTVSGTLSSATAGRHRIRIDYAPDGAPPALALSWDPPGSSPLAPVPAARLAPRYGNPTRTTTHESPGVPALTVDTRYLSGATGLVAAEVVDPLGLALTTRTDYEPVGANGFLRRTARRLPADVNDSDEATKTTYEYHPAEPSSPCVAPIVNQGGALRRVTGPDPDGGGPATAQLTEYAYDDAGRVAGVRRNAETNPDGSPAWACTTYDKRGRVAAVSVPGLGGEPARSVTYEYAVATSGTRNPLVVSVRDAAGTVTTRLDLLGRVDAHMDVHADPLQAATSTTYSYDAAGRLTATAGPGGARTTDYDDATGRLGTQSLDGTVLATAAYDAASGELASVAYANGTSLAAIGRDGAGRTTRLTWAGPANAALAGDEVVRSRSGRVVDQRIDGVDARVGTGGFGAPGSHNFAYDGAGRLTAAHVAGHALTYQFLPAGGCGTKHDEPHDALQRPTATGPSVPGVVERVPRPAPWHPDAA
jgi:YD repeat-containing protein